MLSCSFTNGGNFCNCGARPPDVNLYAMTDPKNALGKAYAGTLRLSQTALRSNLVLTKDARERIADDLEALATLAEDHPEVFSYIKPKGAKP